MSIVNEIILTRVANQMIREVKNALRQGEDPTEKIKEAKKAWNAIQNRMFVRLETPKTREEVINELANIGGVSREEINNLLEEEKALHTAFLRLWEEVKEEEGKMGVEDALKLLSESSKEALKKTGLKMAIRGNEAGIELLALLRTVG